MPTATAAATLDCALLRTAAYRLTAWRDGGREAALTDEEEERFMTAAIRAAHILADMLDAIERPENYQP